MTIYEFVDQLFRQGKVGILIEILEKYSRVLAEQKRECSSLNSEELISLMGSHAASDLDLDLDLDLISDLTSAMESGCEFPQKKKNITNTPDSTYVSASYFSPLTLPQWLFLSLLIELRAVESGTIESDDTIRV